jgi:hypothetical protein
MRLSVLRAGCPVPPGRFLVLISVRGWVDPRAIVRLEWLGQWKNPVTSSVIESMTFRLVAPYFENNKSRPMKSPLCLCVCEPVCVSSLPTFEFLHQSLWNFVCTLGHLNPSQCTESNSVLLKFLPSVIPTLLLLKLLRQNLNIAWTPLPLFIKLGIHIVPYEAISTACIINPSHQ